MSRLKAKKYHVEAVYGSFTGCESRKPFRAVIPQILRWIEQAPARPAFVQRSCAVHMINGQTQKKTGVAILSHRACSFLTMRWSTICQRSGHHLPGQCILLPLHVRRPTSSSSTLLTPLDGGQARAVKARRSRRYSQDLVGFPTKLRQRGSNRSNIRQPRRHF